MSTSLRAGTLRIPAATLGRESELPLLADLGAGGDLSAAPADLAAAGAYGRPHSLLPYRAQDRYDRQREPRDLPTLVLENELLTAVFLPSLGGRLWSLVHRTEGRELLHRNPVLQPANLALRNAWVAGGVEWNLGATGHWPLTCAPLHAVRLALADGTPVLRMYEFERLRRLVLCLDFWLPAGSPTLLLRVSVHNPNTVPAPVYWWSNIAVPQAADVRVLAPSDHAYHYGYSGVLRRLPFPHPQASGNTETTDAAESAGPDASYADRAVDAADYFFDIPDGQRRWITALDGTGSGLLQVSTDRLRGRKLFNWGTAQGGRRWQEWLSGPTSGYLEIQAGLARTQMEHLPLPAGATWEWVEAYGPLSVNPAQVHGSWGQARTAVAEAVDAFVPPGTLEAALEQRPISVPHPELLAPGSGWGALENAVDAVPTDPGLPFGKVESQQRPWLDLHRTGRLPLSDPPAAPVTGPHWRALLEAHPADWHSRYHLGLVRYADGERAGARAAWEQSLAAAENPWSLRCLGQLAATEERPAQAARLLLAAHRLAPTVVELTIEALLALLTDGRPLEVLELVDSLPSAGREPRLRLIEAQAAVAAGRYERARTVLDHGLEVPDLKEGEQSLDALWRTVRPNQPVPHVYDFRMHHQSAHQPAPQPPQP